MTGKKQRTTKNEANQKRTRSDFFVVSINGKKKGACIIPNDATDTVADSLKLVFSANR